MKYTHKIIALFSVVAALLLEAVHVLINPVFISQDASHVVLYTGLIYRLLSLSLLVAGFLLYGFLISKIILKGDHLGRALRETVDTSHTITDAAENAIVMREERKRSEELLLTRGMQLTRLVEQRTAEVEAVNERLRKEILDRTRTEVDLRRSERFLGTIFDSIHDPFSIVDRDYKIVKVNDAYARMKKRQANELLGKPCHEVLHGRSDICGECVIEKTFRSSDPCAKEKLVMNSDGQETWLEIYTYPVFDESGKVSHVIEYARDITDRKKAEDEKTRLIKELNYLSTTDGLTGLFNRRALNDLLVYEIDRAQRYQSELSLIICDIDWFKQINDDYGHRAGDIALQAVTGALKHALRKADILGRYGGDEFMLILPETSLAGAKNLAEKIRAAIEDIKLEISEGKVIRLSTSIGVAGCCVPAEDLDTIVARADAALYASKQAGRNRVSVARA